nr:hypothetical protein [uncultured Draconibacterium sp.]
MKSESPDRKRKEKKQIDVEGIQSKTWLSDKEAVVYTGFNRAQLRNYRINGTRIAGTLPYLLIGGKFIRYNRKEIDEWLVKHRVPEG